MQLDYIPPTVDFDAMAKAQSCDADMQKLQSSTTTLKLITVPMTMCSDTILCDISIGTPRPYVPEQFCHIVFDLLDDISHPGVQATQRLVTGHFVWPGINSVVCSWARTCIHCLRAKVYYHTYNYPTSYLQYTKCAI